MAINEEQTDRFIFALFNLMIRMNEGVQQCCAMHGGLSEKEFKLINYVGQKQNAKMSDLADILSAPLSTITSIVDKLVEKKYLDRYHSGDDRRVVLVALASNGKQTFQDFLARKNEMALKVLSRFEPNEREIMIDSLEKIPLILNELD